MSPRTTGPAEPNRIACSIRRWLLFSLFLVLLVYMVNPRLVLIQGLNIKDLILYTLVGLTAVTLFRSGGGRWRQDGKLHLVFITFIAYLALRSAAAFFASVDLEGMDANGESRMLRMGAVLKAQWIDGFLILLLYRFGVETREDVLWLMWACSLTLLSLCFLVVLAHVLLLLFPPVSLGPSSSPRFWSSNGRGAWLVFFLPFTVAMLEIRKPGPTVRVAWVALGAAATLTACMRIPFSRKRNCSCPSRLS